MRLLLPISSLLITLSLTGCLGVFGKKQSLQYEQLDPGLVREVQALGSHNWIVIVDESVPLHTQRGVRTLLVDKEIPEVLSGVIDVLESQQHVTPIFYRSRELSSVPNEMAQGIDAYRNSITKSLRGYEIRDLQYRTLSRVLGIESKTFAVLVLKTKTSLPYSSIFIELDSGYWDQRSERKLRSKMESEIPTNS